jgi:hypothetical protein
VGTVEAVDTAGTVHIKWDDGATSKLRHDDSDRWIELSNPILAIS